MFAVCASCHQQLPRQSFSQNQWKKYKHRKRCKKCIANNNPVRMLTKSKPSNSYFQQLKKELNPSEYTTFTIAFKHLNEFKQSGSNDKELFKTRVIMPLYELFQCEHRQEYLHKLSTYIPRRFAKYYSNTIQLINDVRKYLNDEQYNNTFHPIMEAMKDCQTEEQFLEKVINPFWILFNNHFDDYVMFTNLAVHIPSKFDAYFLKTIRSKQIEKDFVTLKKKIFASFEKKDAEIFMQIIEDMKCIQTDNEFKEKIVVRLLNLIPTNQWEKRFCLDSLEKHIPHRYIDLYCSELENDAIRVTNLVIDRVCNAFKNDAKYGIFVALAFEQIATTLEWTLVDDNDDIETLDEYFVCIFVDEERHAEPMRELVPIELESIDNNTLRNFVVTSMRNKENDAEIFSNDSVELRCNPLPSELLNRKKFIKFGMKCNKYFIEYFVELIYVFLTGYSFNIELSSSFNSGEREMIECYQMSSNTVSARNSIDFNKHYSIQWKKCMNDFTMGKMNVLEIVFEDCVFCAGCIREQNFDYKYNNWEQSARAKKYAMLIKVMLDCYKCNYKNLTMVDIGFLDYHDLSQRAVYFDYENEYITFESDILTHCRKYIHSDIKGSKKFREKYSEMCYDGYNAMMSYQYEAQAEMMCNDFDLF